MTLTDRPAYSSERTYLVKLHRDAVPRVQDLHGRIEHLASGDRIYFANAEDLVSAITQHAANVDWASSDEVQS